MTMGNHEPDVDSFVFVSPGLFPLTVWVSGSAEVCECCAHNAVASLDFALSCSEYLAVFFAAPLINGAARGPVLLLDTCLGLAPLLGGRNAAPNSRRIQCPPTVGGHLFRPFFGAGIWPPFWDPPLLRTAIIGCRAAAQAATSCWLVCAITSLDGTSANVS